MVGKFVPKAHSKVNGDPVGPLQGEAFLCPLAAILGAALQPQGFRNSELQRSFTLPLPVSGMGFFSCPGDTRVNSLAPKVILSFSCTAGTWGQTEAADGFPGALPCAGALGPRHHRGVRENRLLPPLPDMLNMALTRAAICQAAKNNGYF